MLCTFDVNRYIGIVVYMSGMSIVPCYGIRPDILCPGIESAYM